MSKIDPELIRALSIPLGIVCGTGVAIAIAFAPLPESARGYLTNVAVGLTSGAFGALTAREPNFSVRREGNELEVKTPGDEAGHN